MQDFWNFKDFMVVGGHYWLWLLLAALLGLIVGLLSCGGQDTSR